MLDTLRKLLFRLSPAEQSVCQLAIDHPNAIIDNPISRVAQMAQVSEPTVVRFCRSAGFKGFQSFRQALIKAQAGVSEFVHQDVARNDTPSTILEKVFGSAIAGLSSARNSVSADAFEAAAALLGSAERIEVYGMGGSGIVAQDAQHKWMRLGKPVVAYTDGHIQLQAAAALNPKACVFAISYTGRTLEVIDATRVAKRSGATVVGLTDPGSELSELCDVVLGIGAIEDTQTVAPMSSRLAHLTLVDALYVALAIAGTSDVNRILRGTKTVLESRRASSH